jgi:hypothetical protein
MFRLTFAVLWLGVAAPVMAQTSAEEMQLPPASYEGMTFLHPNGCLYARADAPGYPRRWHAISNGNVVVAGARRGSECTSVLTQPGVASR